MQEEEGLPLPDAVLESARSVVGEIGSVRELHGLSGRTVAAVDGARGTVVAKGPASAMEVVLARQLGETLRDQGVRLVRAHEVVQIAGSGPWLVLEHLGRPLPRPLWGGLAVMTALRRLHRSPVQLVAGHTDRYRPRWDADLTTRARSMLDDDDAVGRALGSLQELARPLWRESHVLHGDPNPHNWRLDDEGGLVLVDAERLTVGSPAIDVAIAIPGLPDVVAVRRALADYGASAPSVQDVLIAKVWTVVELAATAAPGSPAAELVLGLVPDLARWLEGVVIPATGPSER